jgi:hypothetical protein
LNWYFNIIKTAKLRKETPGYTEKHHIIPRCLGGSNCLSNIAVLTAREHYICHLLLARFTTGTAQRKMAHAAFMLTRSSKNQHRYKITARWYQILKEGMSAAKKGIVIPRTEEWARNISKAKKGKSLTDKHKKALTGIKKGIGWTNARKNAGKHVVTPYGIFVSQAEAERQLGLGKNVIAYRIKTQPTEYCIKNDYQIN